MWSVRMERGFFTSSFQKNKRLFSQHTYLPCSTSLLRFLWLTTCLNTFILPRSILEDRDRNFIIHSIFLTRQDDQESEVIAPQTYLRNLQRWETKETHLIWSYIN